MWINLTSNRLAPSAQGAAIQMALDGEARNLARRIPPQTMTYGALINGVQVDPVTYLFLPFFIRVFAFAKLRRREDVLCVGAGTDTKQLA